MRDTAGVISGDIPNAGAPSATPPPVSAPAASTGVIATHVTSPYGDVHKATMVVELLSATSDGALLDPSRVRRVAQAANVSSYRPAHRPWY